MKKLIVFITINLLALSSSAQDINGEWVGYFTYFKGDFFVTNEKIPISLRIDSLLTGYSYTTGKDEYGLDTIYAQKIKVERFSKDSFKIYEFNEIDTRSDENMQTMYLKIIGNSPTKLKGRWESRFGVTKFKGEMILTKQIRKTNVQQEHLQKPGRTM
jgi:hypothetical protein